MVGGSWGTVRGLRLGAEGVAGLEHLVLVGLGDFDGDAVGVHSVLDDWGRGSIDVSEIAFSKSRPTYPREETLRQIV